MNTELWALKAAYQDSTLLVSPSARERAILILESTDTNRYVGQVNAQNAAIRLLLDGGEQQGTHRSPYVGGYLNEWRDDVNAVETVIRTIEYHIELDRLSS